MQFDIRGSYAHVDAMPSRQIEGRLHLDLSCLGPREAAWDLDGPRIDPDRHTLEIKSWVQLHHLKLMTACGRSLARSIAKSKATGTSQATAHSRGPQALERARGMEAA